ncbi:MAG: DUF6056 family protein [Eubacteriales bacterium]|nr:DUF6056 family protein [Eubacteriales bacterium]
MRQIRRRILPAACWAALLASYVPMLAVAFYNRPYYDDFANGGMVTHAVWQETGSLWAVLSAAFSNAHTAYMGWEGNFVPNFLNGIQLGAISFELCWLTPFVMLLALTASLTFLCLSLAQKLKMEKADGWMTAALVCFLSVQLIPHGNEAFYWQSGAVKYTLGHALMAVTFALALRAFPRKKATIALLCVCAFLCGGTNLMTGLATVCALGLYALLLCWKRREGRALLLAAAAAALLGYAVNLIAPGNTVRQGTAVSPGLLRTVAEALVATAEYIGRWTTLPVLGCLLLLLPAVWESAQRSSFSFEKPLLVMGLSFGVLAAELAPPIYAGAYYDSGRLVNTMWLSYCLWMMGNFVYCVGWLAKRGGKAPQRNGYRVIAAILALTVGLLGYGVKKTSSGAAVYALLSGQAARYEQAYDERAARLSDPSVDTVQIGPIPDPPLCFMDETASWKSVREVFGRYYGKTID